MKIGWIGAGIMGSPMICHLMNHGHTVHVYARNTSKVQDIIQKGAILDPSIESLVHQSDVICTMLGFPHDVKEVYETIFQAIEPGKTCIDFTTSDPDLAKELYQLGKEKYVRIMDAPVTGGDVGAKQGTLTILVGSDKEDFEMMQPIFTSFGKNIYYCGEAGSGQTVKIANQIMIANTLQGICEATQYLTSQGMNENALIQFLKEGAAGSKQLDLNGQKMIDHDYAPGFYVKHFVKDLKIATNQNIPLTGVKQVINEYLSLMEQGMENEGTQCLIEYFK